MTTLKTFSPTVRGFTAAGTGFVGLAAGLALSYSAISFPALARIPGLTQKYKVAFWQATFDKGMVTVVPIPMVGSLAFIAAAFSANAQQAGRPILTLAAAAAFSVGNTLFTLAFMSPVNKRLKDLHKRNTLTESEEKESIALIQSWLGFHSIRILSLCVGFALGLKALAE